MANDCSPPFKAIYARILCDAVNHVVVQVPGRSFPGAVLQGDQLFALLNTANNLLLSAQRKDSNQVLYWAESLQTRLQYLYDHYNAIIDRGKHIKPTEAIAQRNPKS